jgi:hypothetical protein
MSGGGNVVCVVVTAEGGIQYVPVMLENTMNNILLTTMYLVAVAYREHYVSVGGRGCVTGVFPHSPAALPINNINHLCSLSVHTTF